ncbi:MAG TPA: CdaR family protein [Vicinamibacterales bacterium]|nr:CdaR family protein [Vicinamibacterales bacterium]
MALPLLRNIWLKFLSICIAALLWLVVAGDRVVERALRVPIEFQNLPQGLEIVGEPPESVDVRLRASSGALGRLGPGEMAAVIDLRTARPGRRLFHLTPASVKGPYGVEVVQIAPSTMPIAFENSAVRIVEVKPFVEGRPAPGYEVASITSTPATVEVIGPESSLRDLDEAMTEPISVSGATRPIREVVTVGVADPRVRLRTPQTAEVSVQVVPGSSQRTLSGVPIQIRNLDNGLRARAQPATISVALRGTRQTIADLSADVLAVAVDASGLTAGDHVCTVMVLAAEGLTIERVEPQTVRLRITRP